MQTKLGWWGKIQERWLWKAKRGLMWKIHWMWTLISFRFQKLASIWIWNGGLGLAVWSAQFRYDTIRLPCPHPGKVNATTARYIYIMDWKIWSLSWKSQCQNFICHQCDFVKSKWYNFSHLFRFIINSRWASRSAGLVFPDTVLVPLGNKESDKWIAAKLFYFQSLCLFFRQNNF